MHTFDFVWVREKPKILKLVHVNHVYKKKKKVFKDTCCAIISSWKENCLNKALKANYQITMAQLMT